jgi:hypothetical protein
MFLKTITRAYLQQNNIALQNTNKQSIIAIH